ncbi:MAG: ferritin [Candidatus Coatesbacteria bacterium]|nr:ferritin [Candidatus Coatesbacteria bacterium]
MISKKVQDAFNKQINEELASAYLYLSMVGYFHSAGLDGMAKWMRVQVQEELGHAMKFFSFINERQGKVELFPIATELHKKWASPLEAFQASNKHEQHITSTIHELVKLAKEERDYSAGIFLQWFVSEQVEEESNTSKVVQMLERIGESGQGLFMADQILGRRGSKAEG